MKIRCFGVNRVKEMSNRRIHAVNIGRENNPNESPNFLIRAFQRFPANLKARRALLVITGCVFFTIMAMADNAIVLVLVGYGIILVAAGLLPRHGIFRPRVAIRKSPSLQRIETIECQAIIEAMPDPALMLNAHGKVLYMNSGSRELFGANLLHQHLSSFIRDPDFLDAINQAPRQNSPLEVFYTERVPVERRLRVTIARFKGARNNIWVPSILVSFRDLTEQGRLDQMRSDFIANVSHELRTPLASVMGFIDTLQGSAKEDPNVQKKFMSIMREQVERMTRLINDLLSLSRVEMSAHILPKDRVDINEVVEYVATTLEPLADESEIKISIESSLEVADVRGARDELIQLFQNLMQNAVKYGSQGGSVNVTIDRTTDDIEDEPGIVVSVKDNGMGIAADDLPRLTERFYRVDVKSSREKGGTGLGLAIVKHIITRHKGEMKISSTLGEGSTFKVQIPEFEMEDED